MTNKFEYELTDFLKPIYPVLKTEQIIDKAYLRSHPNEIFVFGDNVIMEGYGGAAALRDEPNTYGFITKIYPDNKDSSFYRPDHYISIYSMEIKELKKYINKNKDKIFLISKLGAGLANKYGIFEQVIEPRIKKSLEGFSNVRFLW